MTTSVSVELDQTNISVEHCPLCPICGAQGIQLYEGLSDWLWDVPGEWSLRSCSCGIAWLDPRPIADDIPKLYARYYTHGAAEPTALEPIRRQVSQCILARLGYAVESPSGWVPRFLSHVPSIARAAALEVFALPASESGALLDVGCGSGQFLSKMQSFGWTVSGVDPDPSAVAYGLSQGLQVFQGTIADVPEESHYDVITLNHVIEHVSDPVELLRQCGMRLRKGTGRIILTTPNLQSLGHRWFGRYWRGLEVPRHLMLFSIPALTQCVSRAGLMLRSVRTETRLARLIYNPSVCAEAGESRIGDKSNFKIRTKVAGYAFQAVEDSWIRVSKHIGEEIYCVCGAHE
jgi:2-polyprenyl-3-methyl-5-hydroxy-6-metoxy-1,4-benzoquinol methylase